MNTKDDAPAIFIGTAGWNIPRNQKSQFPDSGSHLQRYAARFAAVEINSSFYRPHREATYARWSASVPQNFRFSVKVPNTITHEKRLKDTEAELEEFVAAAGQLGERLGCYLVQLPPSLAFSAREAAAFFKAFRRLSNVDLVCEPRHPRWFTAAADRLLARLQVARVAADPAICPAAGSPGGWDQCFYLRLHGSPRVYYSAYDAKYLDDLARDLLERACIARQGWCIFDNTALGAATQNALELHARLVRRKAAR